MAIEEDVNVAWIQCGRKRAFRTRKIAAGHAKGVHENFGSTMKIYRCTLCGLWHLATAKSK